MRIGEDELRAVVAPAIEYEITDRPRRAR